MRNDVFQKFIYQLVSKLFVLPIYKFVFKGHLLGAENIPQKDAFIMVSNHGSLLDPPLLGHALDEIFLLWRRQNFLKYLSLALLLRLVERIL